MQCEEREQREPMRLRGASVNGGAVGPRQNGTAKELKSH